MEGLCNRTRKETKIMNFTILSQEQESQENEQKTQEFRVEVFDGIEYLVSKTGKKYAIWAIIDSCSG
jgi:hypothetical protein